MSKLAGVGNAWRPLTAVALAASLWASPAVAQEAPAGVAEKSSGREHQVRKGDTLWDLARLYLSDPFRWGAIFEANRGVVSNPHLIYPNNRLVIPGVGSAGAGEAAEGASAGFGSGAVADAAMAPDRTVFYSGGEAVTRGAGGKAGETPVMLEGDAVAVRAVQPGEYLAAPWLAESGALRGVGTVLRVVGHGEDGDKLAQSVHPGDRVYLRRQGRTAPEVGAELLLVHEGRRVSGWGRVVAPNGVGVVEAVERDVIQIVVRRQFGRIQPGDLALPLGPLPDLYGSAQPVSDGAVGTLVGFVEEQPAYDTSDLGFVDLGARRGVAVGDELEVYLPERVTGGWQQTKLPEERVARLRVVRVEERTATVRLIGLWQGALREGLPVRLVGKMP